MSDSRDEIIHIILTGGTIDSVWSGAKDTVVVSEQSVLPEYFDEIRRNLKFYQELTFTEVCMKDSRKLTDEDRENILKAVEASGTDKIIITHGTYTMPVTARFLKENLKRKDQTIVLTGAVVPLKEFNFSDGPFNLGFAFAEVQTLEPGIYVCMNAKVFVPEEVAKNTDEAKFYSKFRNEQ